MGFAKPRRGARVVCIDGSDGNACLLRATLGDVLRGTAYAASIRVHAPEPLVDVPPDSRIHWLPPLATGLTAALQQLPPDTGDVVFVRAGVRVPDGWDTRLAAVAALDSIIGCVSPLCAGLPPFAVQDSATVQSGTDHILLDRCLAELGADRHFQIPTYLPVCVYLKAAVVDAVRNAGESHAAVIRRAGLVSLVATSLLVFLEDAADHEDALRKYAEEMRDHAGGIAWLQDIVASAPLRKMSPARRPVQLHIAHSWGGGIASWIGDFIRGDAERDNLVLKSTGSWDAVGQRIELFTSYDGATAIRSWSLGSPIAASALAHLEYRLLLREIIADFGVEAIIVSSLVGHSLDALRTGLPTLLVAHDHYPFCVALYAYFDGICDTCGTDRLRRCIASNPQHVFFRGAEAAEWEALRRCFVHAVCGNPVTLVAPGRSVLERWQTQMPELKGVPHKIVPHGIDLPVSEPLSALDAGRLRLVVLGNLFPAKGLALLQEALPELLQIAEVFLLGCGEGGGHFKGRRGVTVIQRYARGDLAAHLAAIRPHLGLALSIVPETYSYTLSELWHFRIPVLATRVGSFTDRVEDGRNGFLIDPQVSALLAAVRAIDADRARLATLREVLERQPRRDLRAMTRDYHALLPLPAGRPAAKCAVRAPVDLIQVQPSATYRQAALAFADYSLAKLAASPRAPAWLRAIGRTLGRRLHPLAFRHRRPAA